MPVFLAAQEEFLDDIENEDDEDDDEDDDDEEEEEGEVSNCLPCFLALCTPNHFVAVK